MFIEGTIAYEIYGLFLHLKLAGFRSRFGCSRINYLPR